MGFESLAYNALKDLIRWLRARKPDPELVIRQRQQRKDEIEARLRSRDYGDAIVRDVRRADAYPGHSDDEKGISPWFRVGLLETYHRGIKVGLRIEGLVQGAGGGWRLSDPESEKPDVNAYVVGLIPFERIVNIDWPVTSTIRCRTSTATSKGRSGNHTKRSCSAKDAP